MSFGFPILILRFWADSGDPNVVFLGKRTELLGVKLRSSIH